MVTAEYGGILTQQAVLEAVVLSDHATALRIFAARGEGPLDPRGTYATLSARVQWVRQAADDDAARVLAQVHACRQQIQTLFDAAGPDRGPRRQSPTPPPYIR